MRSQLIIGLLFIVFVYTCSRSCHENDYQRTYTGKTPVDELIKDMSNEPTFSIILYDMNTEGTFFKKFQHQYRVITQNDNGEPKELITGWYEVPKQFFMAHMDDMGMEIVSKSADGKVGKSVGPPGYGSYVGNDNYGHWVHRDGGSFWEWYGKYALFSTIFHTMAYPVHRSYWNDYRRDYYGTGRSYYGPRTSSGRYAYGTNSDLNRNTRSSSSWYTRKSNSNFKQRVRSSTPRSSTKSFGSRSYRSRGGGFGK